MREGCKLVTDLRVKKLNLNYIVKRLRRCSNKYDGCNDCPDKTMCVAAYDERCGQGLEDDPKETK